MNTSFDKVLKAAIGGRSVSDRYALFRKFWRDELNRMARTSGSPPPPDNTDAIVTMFKRDGVDPHFCSLIMNRLPEWRKESRAAANAANAKARWDTPKAAPTTKPKKVLARIKKRRK